MKICVYGGLFGSEGKGCVTEHLATQRRTKASRLVVFGENAPNSGHTCSAGKTRNIPACSFFADTVILGPDSVIDPDLLLADIAAVNRWRLDNDYKNIIEVYIHENAALLYDADKAAEMDVIARVSSTGSGSGAARVAKYFGRLSDRVVSGNDEVVNRLAKSGIRFLTRYQWLTMIESSKGDDWIFECSQGALLDTNWGYYPHVTSRSTLPRAVIARNGLDGCFWEYAGVYRTFPIRTGGPSGPCGGPELQWEDLGLPPEIATVTKRTRRIFEPSQDDLFLSLQLTKPEYVYFTHCDYIFGGNRPDILSPDHVTDVFLEYLEEWQLDLSKFPTKECWVSAKPSEFFYVPLALLQRNS